MSQIITGDSMRVMRSALAEPDSIDAIITDPPYGLNFMGREWDHSVPGVEFWAEMLRMAKPGAHLLAFGGTRTFHRMMCAIEDAGWEIRDTLMWVYGSGMPKSHNLRGDWEGWGTALKPSYEPIIMARKPLAGTVAANVQQYGTGAINIDGCRVATNDKLGAVAEKETTPAQKGNTGWVSPWMSDETARSAHAERVRENVAKAEELGRWPANLCHDGSEEVLAGFPNARPATSRTPSAAKGVTSFGGGNNLTIYQDANESAARFFYCAKASRKDRNEGLEDPGPQLAHGTTLRKVENTATKGNHHPTVKPTNLMRWLVRLVTPPNGTVLDPFCGSGSTGKAAALEWRNFIGIDLDPDYVAIAQARIAHAQGVAA
jgi:site-specific DNA-methyltransferase (adenine-specific)